MKVKRLRGEKVNRYAVLALGDHMTPGFASDPICLLSYWPFSL